MFFSQKICTVLLLFMFIAGTTLADEKEVLFQTIKKYDAIYENGVYSSGFHKTLSPPLFWGQKENRINEYDWQFTQSGKKKALLEILKNIPKQNDDGYVAPNRQCFLFDDKRSGKILINLSPEVPLSSYRDSQDIKNAICDNHAPDSNILSFQIDMFQMALGRGVCNKIVDVDYSQTKVIERNGEICHVLLGNSFYLSKKGTWEIHVLSEADYMLRYARFYSNNDTILEIETFGVKNNSDCVYPERSEIRIPISNRVISHSFIFSQSELSFKSDIFELVTKDFDRELPNDSVVMDDVSGKDKISVVGGETEHEPYPISPTNPMRRLVFIGIVNLLGIILIFYLYRRSRSKKDPKSESMPK
jgi:hypothetical protein